MATRRTTGSARTTGTATAQPTEKAAKGQRAPAIKPGAEANAGAATGVSTGITVSEDARRAMIAQSAYLRGERRGFAAGGQTEDWLAAEAEVDALLRAGAGRPPQ